MSDSTPTPDLATVIDKAIQVARRNLRVALPGQVESYDASTQTCSVQPLVQDGANDETGTRQATRLPVVTHVPVAWLGGGGSSITAALAPGDTVLLVFSSSSIDLWLANGGEVDPLDDRRQHVTDAVAIPCVRAIPNALGPTAVGSGLVLAGTNIQIGGAAAVDAAIKGNAFMTALSALLTAINTFAATCTTTPASSPATTLAGAVTAFLTAANAALSTVVKIG